MDNSVLEKKVAFLESKVDMLETEIESLDGLLKKCGFRKGVASLRLAVQELLKSRGPFGIL